MTQVNSRLPVFHESVVPNHHVQMLVDRPAFSCSLIILLERLVFLLQKVSSIKAIMTDRAAGKAQWGKEEKDLVDAYFNRGPAHIKGIDPSQIHKCSYLKMLREK